MPVIPLSDEPPSEGSETYWVGILSVMLFPHSRDATARRHWQAASMAFSYHHWKSQGVPWHTLAAFHGWLGDVWDLPQSPKRVHSDGFARATRARLSAHILDYLLRLARHHPAHCHLEQAKALTQEELGSAGVSDSTLSKAWADYKLVAHLWMAYLDTRQDQATIGGNALWLERLAIAEAYRKEAETLRVLQPIGKAWRAPDGHPLPAIEDLDIPPLPAEMLAFLAREFPG